jgi:hypothetical protein
VPILLHDARCIAVDHVAWAIFQKYENGDERFYRIFENKMIVEQVIRQELW